MKKPLEILAAVFPYSLALWLCLAGMRIYESFSYSPAEVQGLTSRFYPLGFFIDLLIVLILVCMSTLLQWGLSFLKMRSKTMVFHVLAVPVLLLTFGLIQYFLVAGMLLDESVFFFSMHELKTIGGIGSRFSVGIVLSILALIACYFLLGRFFGRKIPLRQSVIGGFLVASCLAVFLYPFTYFESLESHYETLLTNNPLSYFVHRSLTHSGDKLQNVSVSPADFQGLDPNFLGGDAVSPNAPLFHKLPDHSRFSEFFHKSADGPPNIVFIIVESLSSDLVGMNGASSGNLLPFTDSLAKQSLYFPNFLSTCERTHNVLPAALASLPNAPNGNRFMQMKYPEHWSLMSLLQPYYYSRFYCGVYLNFTNMDGFMNANKTNFLVNRWEEKFRNISSQEGNIWGYPDGMMFEQTQIDQKKLQLEKGKKRMDILLTITTHDPFYVPNKPKYEKIARQRLKQATGVSPERRAFMEQYIPKFAAFAYLDSELKNYFERAKKLPGYEKTIFFVFGDHGSAEVNIDNELSAFNIPLIVYSPLLKGPKQFNSVSTQLDLAPTVLNYLRLTYGLDVPSSVPFMGKELSFVEKYENKRSLPLNSYRLQNEFIMHREHFLFHGQLFKVGNNLTLRPSNDAAMRKTLETQLRYYEALSEYTIFGNRILPKEIVDKSIREQGKILSRFELSDPGKEQSNAEYMNVGAALAIPTHVSFVEIQVECDYYAGSKSYFSDFPKLTASLENLNGSSNEMVSWLQGEFSGTRKFKANSWNRIYASVKIPVKDLSVHKNNKLSYYLLNSEKKSYRIRNIRTKVISK